MRKETQIDVVGQAYKQFRACTTLASKQHYLARMQALAMDLQKELFQETMKQIPSTVILTNGDTAAHIQSDTKRSREADKDKKPVVRRAAISSREFATLAAKADEPKKPIRRTQNGPGVKPFVRSRKPVKEAPKELLEGFWHDPSTKESRKDTNDLPRVELCAMAKSYPGKDAVVTMMAGVQAAAKQNRFKGWSTCRICGEKNGSTEYVLGNVRWPDGLMHYVTAHNVVLTGAFVQFLIGRVPSRTKMKIQKEIGPLGKIRVRAGEQDYKRISYDAFTAK